MRIIRMAGTGMTLIRALITGGGVTPTGPIDDGLFQTLSLMYELINNGITDYAGANAYIVSGPGKGKYSLALLNNISSLYNLTLVGGLTEAATLFQPDFTVLMKQIKEAAGANPGFNTPRIIIDIKNIVSMAPGGVFSSTRTIQYPMFSGLLNKFTTEIASAATSVKNVPLASAISSGGLWKPEQLARATRLGTPQPWMYANANKLIQEIMRERHDIKQHFLQNYEIIKEKFMKPVGAIGFNEQEKIEQERKRAELRRMDPSLLDPTKPRPPGLPPVEETIHHDVSAEQLINPYFLSALTIFFTQYYKEIYKLPV